MPGNSINVDLTDRVSGMLAGVDRAVRSPVLRAVVGEAAKDLLVAHFAKLNAERHKNEVGRQFYAGAAKSVQDPRVSGDNVVIAVGQKGIAQRYYGGTIVAGSGGTGKKWITIPAIPAALGRTAGDFSNLKFVFFRGKGQHGPGYGADDLAALVSNDPQKASFSKGTKAQKQRGARLVPREDGKLPVVFWLKRSVTQKADPSVLPSEAELAAAGYRAGADYLREAAELDAGGTQP